MFKRRIRLLVLLVCALCLSACGGLAKMALEPTPEYEPRSKGGNKSPYTVFGKTYTVMDSAAGYKEAGIASWYGKKFHGRKTSNGERYNMYAVSAAHKSLPIPTYVKVTNTGNGKTLIVRVNDRGPFHQGRIIDLSYAAALKLGFVEQGTAKVIVEALSYASRQARVSPIVESLASIVKLPARRPASALLDGAAKIPDKNIEPSIKRYLQVGVFSEQATAKALVKQLKEFIGHPVLSKPAIKVGAYSVVVGPVLSDNELERVTTLLQFHGIEEVYTVYDFD